MSDSIHPTAIHHLPAFITAPGQSDVLFNVVVIFMILAIFALGTFYLRLHSLPETMAHKSHKVQYELVAVLGLISLLTHNNIFWIAALILALIDLPDFSSPLASIARSLERLAGKVDTPPAPVTTEPETTASHVAAPSDQPSVEGKA
ncbi:MULTISPECIES: hypothetical protein [unclassified Ensifer]|uniref:hypothetical protein n=1 Tax=unclassified Ensifer TaxID=2633371 RepID=UPI0008139F07|nr:MULTISPECIES: hypothetical protein [unclassified Ensifer]OCP01749.1 hypothetical protein BC362_21255 [Ensifer sp. LC14]OCP09538.1 hypothetical protein BC374_02995 [Ensifer sp. LC13]OCP10709.1 hypothetical protein BBX50_03335 [Ensifer sp. LC11]OCP32786.1 hypothetical protein BC364_02995 [Ensifer sp. LC499]